MVARIHLNATDANTADLIFSFIHSTKSAFVANPSAGIAFNVSCNLLSYVNESRMIFSASAYVNVSS